MEPDVLLELVATALIVLLAVEIAIRLAGLADFPLYRPQWPESYRMKPNQEGSFRNRAFWRYDTRGMRSVSEIADFAGVTLLVGDSIVDGSVTIDQRETLAAELAHASKVKVYPLAAGGWAFANQLRALRATEGWTRAARLIFILNTGDFDTVALASNELSFPTRKPLLMSAWLARRVLYRRKRLPRWLGPRIVPPLPVPSRPELLAEFAQLVSEFSGPVTIVRYPKQDEDPRSEAFYDELFAIVSARGKLIDLAGRAEWDGSCYLDIIHPNAKGNAVLGRILAREAA